MWHIDPTSLRLFIAVCEEGTIAKASAREFIAPSAVSKRIADIESDLGIPMLLRSKRGVTPTPAGEALLRHARQLMRSMERLQGELSEYAEGARGHVKIFANISSIMEFLPEELSAFMLAHENIQVDIEERFSPDVVRGVVEGQADFGICRKSMAAGTLELIPYRQDHLALVVNAQHPLANRTSITLRETLDYDHIGLSAFSTLTSFMQTAARESGQELKIRAHVSSFDAAYRLVQVGLAQTIVPREAVSRYTELFGLRLVPLTDPWAQGEIVVCVRDAEALSLSARRLLDHLLARAH
ncbi:LysR family transcriptional regulator [Pseudomonas oryzihabitans]|uniref:LysR family transcriptional regulator n=1 Tax=Pseudomonas oryzihabitans TaxID=47885 RepID=A0ABX3IVM6_9PSED|nr:LysR family transcriptional regulator [Pseudomonas psychrotolerans]ONN71058.1 LysR family transcriptional regulator [Pseudomonas psychrotolerans]